MANKKRYVLKNIKNNTYARGHDYISWTPEISEARVYYNRVNPHTFDVKYVEVVTITKEEYERLLKIEHRRDIDLAYASAAPRFGSADSDD